MATKGERLVQEIHQNLQRLPLIPLDPNALPFKPNANTHKTTLSGTLVPAFIIGTKRCYNVDYYVCLTLDFNKKKFSHKLILCKKQPKVVAEKLKKLVKNDPAIKLNMQPIVKANIKLKMPKNQCYVVEGTLSELDSYRDYYREGYSGILAHNFSAWLNLDFVKPENFIPTISDSKNQNANLSQYFEHQMCHFNFVREKSLKQFGIEKYPQMMEVRFNTVYESNENTNLQFKCPDEYLNHNGLLRVSKVRKTRQNRERNSSGEVQPNYFICNTIPVEIKGYRTHCQNHKSVRIYHGCPKFKATDIDFDYPTKYFRPVYRPEVGPRYVILRHDFCREEKYVLYSIVARLD